MNKSLSQILTSHGGGKIALSGGVDSMTLAYAAFMTLPESYTMIHAISPAVPEQATGRVKNYAEKFGWKLEILNANEFNDPNYLANPVNRCFYCKSNLYDTLSKFGVGKVMSGTNLDDLSDYRPGLQAADDFEVIHPFVEAQMSKKDIRAMASGFGLPDIAALPASPCLASRVETGIRILSDDLKFIEKIEAFLQRRLNPETVRCRLKKDTIGISLNPACLYDLSESQIHTLKDDINNMGGRAYDKPIVFGTYKMGESFLNKKQT